jgi:hypothetical protein
MGVRDLGEAAHAVAGCWVMTVSARMVSGLAEVGRGAYIIDPSNHLAVIWR